MWLSKGNAVAIIATGRWRMLISGKKQMDCKQVTWKWIFTSRSTGWSICFFILLGHVTNSKCHRKVQPLPCLFILCAEVALRPAAFARSLRVKISQIDYSPRIAILQNKAASLLTWWIFLCCAVNLPKLRPPDKRARKRNKQRITIRRTILPSILIL